jgi:hypothetical protein
LLGAEKFSDGLKFLFKERKHDERGKNWLQNRIAPDGGVSACDSKDCPDASKIRAVIYST